MALDLVILRTLKYRTEFNKFHRVIPEGILDAATSALLRDYGKWFKQHPEADRIDMDSFGTWLRLAHPKVKEEKMALIQGQLRAAASDVSDDIKAGIVEQIASAHFATKAQGLLETWAEGDEVDLLRAFSEEVQWLQAAANRTIKTSLVEVDIEELLDEDENDEGLTWPLECLNESMRPLRGGDFGIIAARVDAGKTSFICDTVRFMAPQLPIGRPVVWLNNEGPGKRIKGRLYQSALNATFEELREMRKAGTLKSAYATAVGGDTRVQVHDIHDWHMGDVLSLLERLSPGLVVVDMADNIRFDGEVANGGQRTDQFLETMYQTWRNIGVRMDVPVLATSQLSADGEGLMYPLQSMLKDSKTGKQGAAEFILTIGKSNDPLLERSRFIGLNKNKLGRPGFPRDPRCEVEFDYDRGRFNMPQ